MERHIVRYDSQTYNSWQPIFRAGWITWIFYNACQKIKAQIQYDTIFQKFHHQHVNEGVSLLKLFSCSNRVLDFRSINTCHIWTWIIPECSDHIVSTWNSQVSWSVEVSSDDGQLKYSSFVSIETTQGICFFSLKRGSSDQDSKLVATM